eukprot:scaffold7176_cov62-Isochrysis_galbana.AAC.1
MMCLTTKSVFHPTSRQPRSERSGAHTRGTPCRYFVPHAAPPAGIASPTHPCRYAFLTRHPCRYGFPHAVPLPVCFPHAAPLPVWLSSRGPSA